jgi:hypothetical protein
MSGTAQLTNFPAPITVSDADQVYIAQGEPGVAVEKAATRGQLVATLYYANYADLQAALSQNEITLPREVLILADETMNNQPIKYFIDLSGNLYWTAMVLKAGT